MNVLPEGGHLPRPRATAPAALKSGVKERLALLAALAKPQGGLGGVFQVLTSGLHVQRVQITEGH